MILLKFDDALFVTLFMLFVYNTLLDFFSLSLADIFFCSLLLDFSICTLSALLVENIEGTLSFNSIHCTFSGLLSANYRNIN